MNPDDLLQLLDLPGKEVAPASTTDLTIHPSAPPPADTSLSLTAFQHDEWSLRRGRDLLIESERLRKLGLAEPAIADFHVAAFDPAPQLLPDCADRSLHAFLTQLLDTPDYRSLHIMTRLDDTAASIATTVFAEQFAALGTATGSQTSQDPLEAEMSIFRAVGRAITHAREAVVECQDIVAALGMGPGSPGSNDPQVIATLYRQVRSHPCLRRICELAGRYRRLAQSKQRRKVLHGVDDLIGVEPGGELARILPHELAKLAIPELEMDTLRRLVERQTLCRAYQSSEPVGKGPIIVAVDESGSMQGERVHTAKALALALAWIARQQQRWIALIAYSGESGERLLSLPPGKWDEQALIDWLSNFIGYGSSLDVPVRELPSYYQRLRAPVGTTDVIFLTDARCSIPASLREEFLRWKQQVTARLITLVIDSEPGDLTLISDEIHRVRSLAVYESAVERLLSL